MFYIYSDGKPIYAPHLSTEGYGVLSPKLTVELNKAGSLDFTLPPGNAMYDDLHKLKSIITVFQNGDELFRGRILHDEKDFYKQKKVYCEGELAFFLDSKQRPYSATKTVKEWFEYYISNHNLRVESTKQFVVGDITVENSSESLTIKSDDYATTLTEIENRLLADYGGYLSIRENSGKRYIDWLSESGTNNSQIIEFGRNLLDITEYITAENVFTVLIPLGKSSSSGSTNKNLTISSVNDGKDYLEDATGISLFGRIEETIDWPEIESASILKQLGQLVLSQNIEQSITLTIRAIDLYLIDNAVESIRIGDWVRVISLPHGLDKQFQCTKIVYDLVSPEQTEYTFGIAYTSLTDKQTNDEKNIQTTTTIVKDSVRMANNAAQTALTANENVQTIIAQMPTEYVQTSAYESHLADFQALIARVETLEERSTT